MIGADEFILSLSDGRAISVPYCCYPRLQDATVEQRRHFELYAGGRMLHWPDIDEDVEVQHVIEGRIPVRTERKSPVVAEGKAEYGKRK